MSNYKRIDYNDVVKSTGVKEIIHYLIDNAYQVEEKNIESMWKIMCKFYDKLSKSYEIYEALGALDGGVESCNHGCSFFSFDFEINYTLKRLSTIYVSEIQTLFDFFDDVTIEAVDNCLIVSCTINSDLDCPSVPKELSDFYDEECKIYRAEYIDSSTRREFVNGLIEAILEEEDGDC